MGRLSGKIAIVTGGAQGMGASHARTFVEHGAHVVITDIDNTGQQVADELGNSAIFVKHDVSSSMDWSDVIERTSSRFGTPNVLVNNAGILGDIASTSEMSEKEFRRVWEVNQLGTYLGMRAVIPVMLGGGGSIVNISSAAGLAAVYGSPSVGYVGSKFAVRGMTKQAAVEFGLHGIRANSVHPGAIQTPMLLAGLSDGVTEATSRIPLGRLGAVEEVSQLVLFLASDEASYITGAEFAVDGGLTCL